MPCLLNVQSFLISPDLIASQLLLEIVHCIPLSPQSLSSHLISSHLSLAQLFSAGHNCPLLISCHLSLSHLFSSSHSFSQILTALNSAKLSAAHVSSSFVFSPSLSSSHIFWALLTSPQLISALVSSSHLISALLSSSQRTLKSSQPFSGPKPAQNKDLGAKASDPYAFHREDLTQRTFTHSKSLYTQKLIHRDTQASTQRQGSLYTETRKLLLTTSFYIEQAFTHSKLMHAEAFAHRSFYTEKPWHSEDFTHSTLLHTETLWNFYIEKPNFTQKLLHTARFHTEKPLHRSLYTEKLYTQKLLHTANFHTEKPLHAPTRRSIYTEKLLHTEAFTHRSLYTQQAFTQKSLYTEKLLHKKAFRHRSFYAYKPFRTKVWEIAARKPDLSAEAKKRLKHFLKDILKRKITSAKIEKTCWQITIATLMQPLQYDLRCPAA